MFKQAWASLLVATNLFFGFVFSQKAGIPIWDQQKENLNTIDWLVKPVNSKAQVFRSADNKNIILYNGLVKRAFRLSPNLACIDYKNMSNGQQLLRAVKAEAELTINGKPYNVGGLHGQKENAYLLPEWLDNFKAGESDFQLEKYEITGLQPFINWKPSNWWASNTTQPSGRVVSFTYSSKAQELKGMVVKVHYALYDGLPLIAKWLTIENRGGAAVKINRVKNEILAVVEEESAVVGNSGNMKKQHGIYVETDYAFNNAMRYDISDQTTHWETDSSYTSQVNYDYQTPCLLEVYPEKAPGIEL